LSFFTSLHHSINLSGVCCVGDCALGNLGLSLRDEEVPKSECVCVWSQKGAPVSSLEVPAAKELRSQQLKVSGGVCAIP